MLEDALSPLPRAHPVRDVVGVPMQITVVAHQGQPLPLFRAQLLSYRCFLLNRVITLLSQKCEIFLRSAQRRLQSNCLVLPFADRLLIALTNLLII